MIEERSLAIAIDLHEEGMEGGRIPFPSKFLSVFPVPLAKIAFPLRKMVSHYKF